MQRQHTMGVPSGDPHAPPIGQIIDNLIGLAKRLGTLAHRRDDRDLAARATASLTTVRPLHTAAAVRTPLAGVPDAPQGGAS